MKIYTKTGDKGQTSLVGGSRTSKADPRLETYGTIDEVNSSIGVAISFLDRDQRQQSAWKTLQLIQHQLFNLGSRLACEDENLLKKLPALNMGLVGSMEAEIDLMEKSLPKLQQFILPGGTTLAAQLHLSRTICRRAERILIRFAKENGMGAEEEITFLNRLSDFLFVAARSANHSAGLSDITWQKE